MALSPGEVGEENEETEEEGAGSTLESSCRDSNKGENGIGVMALRTTKVEKNQLGKLMINPGKVNVSIYGAPTFPRGNEPRFPSRGRPWLVDMGNVAITDNLKIHLQYNQELYL